MTPDFADQEAERIITGLAWTYKPFLEKEIAEALRKAYEQGLDQKWGLIKRSPTTQLVFEAGFNAAKEMAAKMAQRHAKECRGIESFEGEGEALHIRDEIRALKPEGE